VVSSEPIGSQQLTQPWPVVALLAMLSVGLLGWMLGRTPVAHGDSGEYLLTVEAFANHGAPDIRPQDVTALTSRAAPQALRGSFGRLWHAVRRSVHGRWYTYHFWAYPLAVLPARLILGTVCANALAAPQVTNAVLLIAAAWFVLLAPWLDPKVARWWSLLSLIGPPAWFCVWPHPEVFSFSLVTVALACAAGRRFVPATAAVALASAQNPPLAPIAAALAVIVASGPGPRARRIGLALASVAPALAPPLFYMLTFGRPSLILGESASFDSVSLSKAATLLIDLNTGLLPYMPGVVALALAGLVRSMRRTGPFPPPPACFAFFAVGALGASAGILWNFGTSGPSRYALWLSPFVVLPAAQWATRRGGVVALAAALAAQTAVVVARLPAWGEDDERRHSYAAAFVLRRWPALYEPHPDIFRDRTPSVAEGGPYVFRDGPRCRKALAQKRHADALAAACGPLPPEFLTWTAEIARAGRGRSGWRYITYSAAR
jgi:hypothetical protein